MLVIGGGRFGRLALERLPGRVATVVEPSPDQALADLAARQGAALVPAQGAPFLAQALEGPQPPRWVVPALPRHLLHDWLLLTMAGQGAAALEAPAEVLPAVASLMSGGEGQWFLSLADFRCPDDCPEPAEICTHTGQPRGEPLFQRLASLRPPGWQMATLRSRQLAPGVGGCLASEMLALREAIKAQGGDWLVATACRCHGVVSGLHLPDNVRHG